MLIKSSLITKKLQITSSMKIVTIKVRTYA